MAPRTTLVTARVDLSQVANVEQVTRSTRTSFLRTNLITPSGITSVLVYSGITTSFVAKPKK